MFKNGYTINKNAERSCITMLKDYLEGLKRERDGYIMKNFKNGAEIRCTEEYVRFWIDRGFEIIAKKPIRLIED